MSESKDSEGFLCSRLGISSPFIVYLIAKASHVDLYSKSWSGEIYSASFVIWQRHWIQGWTKTWNQWYKLPHWVASSQPKLFSLLPLILINVNFIMLIHGLKSVGCILDKIQTSSLGLSDPLSDLNSLANWSIYLLFYVPHTSISL